ncbi:MAG TPA: response regulator [Phycisphaerae bacterium]|nr:response regulator [Phycisphaerae bacterium]
MNGTILLIQGQPLYRELFSEILEKHDFKVITAGHGLEALARLREWNIDLVVTDIVLPGMDGFEFLRRLRRGHALLPVMILTEVRDKESVIHAGALGVRDYIIKENFSEERLMARARALIAAAMAKGGAAPVRRITVESQ